MCLGIPGKVLKVEERDLWLIGRVSFAGMEREVVLTFVPEAKVGDYVIVHVGYAISLLDAAAAHRTLELLEEVERCMDGSQP